MLSLVDAAGQKTAGGPESTGGRALGVAQRRGTRVARSNCCMQSTCRKLAIGFERWQDFK